MGKRHDGDMQTRPIRDNVFNSYGKYYDIIYADKDYEKESDFLEQTFRKHSKNMPKAIIDVGCGTGGHAIPLAKRGYEITGIDASETMINLAKEKARKAGVKADFYRIDVSRLQLDKKFDACISMFAVISYLTDNKSISSSLSNIRNHIKKDSLFIFDFWYGPAVLSILPSIKIKKVEKGGIKVIRFAEPYLDTLHQICRINYYLLACKGRTILEEVEEEHAMRFFFPEEIKYFLENSDFKLLKLCSFPNLDEQPTLQTWNVAAISRAA